MAESSLCPRCGGAIPGDAPRGLCPACLMAFALGDEPVEPSPKGPLDPATTISPDQSMHAESDQSTLFEVATWPREIPDPSDVAAPPPGTTSSPPPGRPR